LDAWRDVVGKGATNLDDVTVVANTSSLQSAYRRGAEPKKKAIWRLFLIVLFSKKIDD
jgi:hypothetical protein